MISQAAYRRLGRSLIAAILALHIFFLWSIRGRISRGDPDFTVYFTAAKMLREGLGTQLYSPSVQYKVQQEFATNSDIRRGPLPYIHPPFEALLFLPLTFVSYSAAFLFWNFINLGMLLGVCILLRWSLVSLRRIPLTDCLLACLAFFPVLGNFHQGQDAILLLLVLVLGFRALDRGADLSAGCWIAVGIFKFQFVLPIAILLILWRGRRFATGFGIVVTAAMAISVALVGWRGAIVYPTYSWQVISNVNFGGLPYRIMPNLTGIMNGWPILEKVGWPLRFATLTVSASLWIVLAFMKKQANRPELFNLCMACAIIGALLISYNTNTYDLSLLVLPAALLLNHCFLSVDPRRMLNAMFLPAAPLFLSPLWFFLWLHWMRTNLMAVFLLGWCYVIWREVQRLASDHKEVSSLLPEISAQSNYPEAVP